MLTLISIARAFVEVLDTELPRPVRTSLAFGQLLPRLSSLVLLAAAVCAVEARASTFSTILTSASQLSSEDTLLNPLAANVDNQGLATVSSTYSGSPMSLLVPGSNTLTLSSSTNAFEIDQVGVNYGASAFPKNTVLLGAGGFQGSSGGPVTLTFATPISQFGVNIEDFNTGTYDLNFTAYDAAGKQIAYVNANLDSSLEGNDPKTLSFAGLSVTGDTITKVVFDDLATSGYPATNPNKGTDDLLFGNVKYADASPVPEPSPIALFGIVLLAAPCIRSATGSGLVRSD